MALCELHTAPDAAEPDCPPIDHPELFPITSFGDFLQGPARAESALQVKLETRGVTQQSKQQELFNTRLLFKDTVTRKLRAIGMLDVADQLSECHSTQSWAQCGNCSAVRTFWNRCERFFCPCCQPILARDRADSIQWWTKEVTQPKHLVLTARNTDTITFSQVKRFKKNLTALRRSKCARGWRGGTWALEVTNEGRGWHLHAHLLIDAHWLDMPAISVRWAQLVGQDFVICKAKDVRGGSYLKEVTKYAVKGSELASWSGEDIAHFINAFTGQRSFGVFGSLYGKRTQWAEWLKTLKGDRRACECGSCNWKLYNSQEWEAHQITFDRQSTTTIPPRSVTPTSPQQNLRLAININAIKAIAR